MTEKQDELGEGPGSNWPYLVAKTVVVCITAAIAVAFHWGMQMLVYGDSVWNRIFPGLQP